MRKRTPKENDQEQIDKAYEILIDTIMEHQDEIEASLWMGAMIGALAIKYEESEVPFEYFKKEMALAVENYRYG